MYNFINIRCIENKLVSLELVLLMQQNRNGGSKTNITKVNWRLGSRRAQKHQHDSMFSVARRLNQRLFPSSQRQHHFFTFSLSLMASNNNYSPSRVSSPFSTYSPSNPTLKRVGTHNGSFHCDEALGCFMIRLTNKFFNAEIVRTRDPKVSTLLHSTCLIICLFVYIYLITSTTIILRWHSLRTQSLMYWLIPELIHNNPAVISWITRPMYRWHITISSTQYLCGFLRWKMMMCLQVLETLDAVLDVGGVYDPTQDRYDHHQKGFGEVFGHGFNTKLSSAGLVYKVN